MINIQPYQQKLEALREYMDAKIDSVVVIDMWMDLQVCPTEYYIKNKLPIPKPYQKMFYFYVNNTLKTNTV